MEFIIQAYETQCHGGVRVSTHGHVGIPRPQLLGLLQMWKHILICAQKHPVANRTLVETLSAFMK